VKKITYLVITGLVAIILISLLAGCAQTQLVPLPMNVHDLSLTRVWYRFLDCSGMQERSGNLSSFALMTDKNGAVLTVHLEFTGISAKGKPSSYFADVNCKGDFHYQEYDLKNSVTQTYSPLVVLSEIDKLGLSSISLGPEGFYGFMDFSGGGRSAFTVDRYDIFELQNGRLLPLKELTFNTNTLVGKITISTNISSGSTSATATAFAPPTETNTIHTSKPVPAEARTMQIWFISQDMNKAETVEYLKD
jgi:hypothetical protein